MDCEHAANLISARVDGEISAGDDAVLDAHLAGCAACRAALDAAALQDAAMVRAFAGGRDAAAALARRVADEFSVPASASPAAAVAAAGDDGRRRRFGRWGGWMVAAAAVVAVAVFVRPANRPATPWQAAIQPAVEPATQPAHAVAHLALASGEVFTCPSGGKSWQAMAPGARVEPGAKVRTADAAKCELTLPGGSRLRLNSGTELQFAAAGDVQLSGGQIWSAVPPDAGPLRITAGNANVTTGRPSGRAGDAAAAAQLDVARAADAATVTVVAGSAHVDGADQVTTVRGGEFLRVGAAGSGSGSAFASFACQPLTDPLEATRWLDDLLVLLPPDDPELLARVDALLARIVAERQRGSGAARASPAPAPGPVERDVRARGPAWAASIARYAVGHLSAPTEADRDKRRTAVRLLADLAPPSCVGDLIALLDDDDGEVRLHAAAALNRLTGQTLGFSPEQCAASPRDPAPAAAWRAWWARDRAANPAPP